MVKGGSFSSEKVRAAVIVEGSGPYNVRQTGVQDSGGLLAKVFFALFYHFLSQTEVVIC